MLKKDRTYKKGKFVIITETGKISEKVNKN